MTHFARRQRARAPRKVCLSLYQARRSALIRDDARSSVSDVSINPSPKGPTVPEPRRGVSGGVGNTQLVARYVRDQAQDYDVVGWVPAQQSPIAELSELYYHCQPSNSPSTLGGTPTDWSVQCHDTSSTPGVL